MSTVVIADLEEMIALEMRGASDEDWIIASGHGEGSVADKICCALGAVGRDQLGTPGFFQAVRDRLGIDEYDFDDIALGFDGGRPAYAADVNLHDLGCRLRLLGARINARAEDAS